MTRWKSLWCWEESETKEGEGNGERDGSMIKWSDEPEYKETSGGSTRQKRITSDLLMESLRTNSESEQTNKYALHENKENMKSM